MIQENIKDLLEELDFYLEQDLLLVSSFRDRSFLYQTKFLEGTPANSIFLVIVPSDLILKREISQIQNKKEFTNNFVSLSSDLLPKQYRETLLKAVGYSKDSISSPDFKPNRPKMIFSTPEPFLRLFSRLGVSSRNIDDSAISENPDYLNSEAQQKTDLIIKNINKIAFCDLDLISTESVLSKNKYFEALRLIKDLKKTTWFLSSYLNSSSLDKFYRLFPKTKVLYSDLNLDFVALRPDLFFSLNELEKNLISSCFRKKDSNTLIITDEDNLFQFGDRLREKFYRISPNLNFKILHDQIPLDQRACIFDQLLGDESIVLLTNRNLLWQISEIKAKLGQLVYYSSEFCLRDLYQDLNYLSFDLDYLKKSSQKLSVRFLIYSKDLKEKTEKITSHKRSEGLKLNYVQKNRELLEWLSNLKDCRFDSFREILASSFPEAIRCNSCDVCKEEKKSIFWKLRLSLLKKNLSL